MAEPALIARRVASGVLVLLAALYPLWAWWGLNRFGIVPVAASLAAVMLLRALLKGGREAWGCFLISTALCLASTLLDREAPMLLYPVCVNLFMLWLFGSSLVGGSMPLVERLARLKEKNLPPEGVRWCRGVTVTWCIFFVVNGSVALFTVLHGDRSLWMLWNGAVSYVLMGVLFAGEFLLRMIVMRRQVDRSQNSEQDSEQDSGASR
ncbi:strain DSM [Sutterella sp.]|uniref:COG4648 family protein n=1 Tax=Sutterella sp. TaxID=1981025 RepID=UPI0026E085C9|nr:strain DSM [Sutterella sp.]MDO5530949.1 strain DSM [Sutterella sp.]